MSHRISWSTTPLAAALGLALLLALGLTLAPAHAQAPADQPAAQPTPTPTPAPAAAAAPAPTPSAMPEGSNKGYEEQITVTSRKMGEETVQTVPVSIAAPTEEQLRDRGAADLEGVSRNVAGFTVQSLGPGQSQVAIRGVSAGQIVRDQPGVKEQVGVYLDESPIALSLYTPDIDLFDVSRVEVLRGPQGTVFGAGSETGTVRYISNAPELNHAESIGEFTLNDVSGGGIGGSGKVAANQPLGDKAALRVVGYYTGYGGFIDAVGPSATVKNANSGYRGGGRISLFAKPNDQLTITPRLVYQKVDMNGWNRRDIFNILGNQYTTTRPAVTLGKWDQYIQLPEPVVDTFVLGDLNVGYAINPNLNLTSITSYIDRDINVTRDAGALTSSITGGSLGEREQVYTLDSPLKDLTHSNVWTEELRLNGGHDHLRWVSGLFYEDSKRDYGQDLFVNGWARLASPFGLEVFGTDEHLYHSDLHYDLKNKAAFGEATWSVNDRFDLSGGLRYYNYDEHRTILFSGGFAVPTNEAGSTSADGFAPRLIASLKMGQATLLNAQVSKGFRLGGINDPLNAPICNPQDLAAGSGHSTFGDETTWNYEVGTKSTVMGGRGTVNVSAYYMDIKDLQVPVDFGSCSSRIVFNVPNSVNKGAELELAAAPSPSFDFSLSASYNNGELRSTIYAGDQVIGGIRAGNRLPTVPKMQVAATATYQWTVGSDAVGFLTGTYQYVGSRFTRLSDEEPGAGITHLFTNVGDTTVSVLNFNTELAAYNLVNLRVGVVHERTEVAIFVNNATDEQAQLAVDRERGQRARFGYLVNDPRTIGITTRLHF
jgi:iron complex outermembrane receptor protein